MTSLFVLARKTAKGGERERGSIFDAVLTNAGRINGWDLVVSSAPYIVGAWLLDRTGAP